MQSTFNLSDQEKAEIVFTERHISHLNSNIFDTNNPIHYTDQPLYSAKNDTNREFDVKNNIIDIPMQKNAAPPVGLNKAIQCFGIDTVLENITEFLASYQDKSFPLVSIGSGNGALEKLILERNNKTNIICIDPFPSSFSQIPIQLSPDYAYDLDLIGANPAIVENCLLLLNWCNPNYSTYDYDAIQRLKPVAFISIYETFRGGNGAAGGEQFYNYIHKTTDYKLIHSTQGIGSGLLIEWYQKCDYEENIIRTTTLPTDVVLEKPFGDEKCIIM